MGNGIQLLFSNLAKNRHKSVLKALKRMRMGIGSPRAMLFGPANKKPMAALAQKPNVRLIFCRWAMWCWCGPFWMRRARLKDGLCAKCRKCRGRLWPWMLIRAELFRCRVDFLMKRLFITAPHKQTGSQDLVLNLLFTQRRLIAAIHPQQS